MGVQDVISGLSDNPYFGAGFGLFGLGMTAALARKGAAVGMIMFRRHCMTTVEVTCKDKSYPWLLEWISSRGARETQHLSLDTTFVESESGKIDTRFGFKPSVGVHVMRYGGTWFRVERTREQRMMEPWETVELTTFGNKKGVVVRMLEEAREMVMSQHQGKTVMYTVIGTDWRPFGHPRARRPINSVVLDGGVAGQILDDVRSFIASASWYRRRGIPYRRGYLLYGPPGCGKTSFITALAGELHFSICVLNLADRGMTDDRLMHRLADAPENSIILLEDVDAAFGSRESNPAIEAAYQGLSRLTLSGLLNAIDGVTSTEGRILFMTTNYEERLDPALIRPGRVDYKQRIGFCSRQQLSAMFENFYPDAAVGLSSRFADAVSSNSGRVSAAQVQGLFMFYKHSAGEAMDNAHRLYTTKAEAGEADCSMTGCLE